MSDRLLRQKSHRTECAQRALRHDDPSYVLPCLDHAGTEEKIQWLIWASECTPMASACQKAVMERMSTRSIRLAVDHMMPRRGMVFERLVPLVDALPAPMQRSVMNHILLSSATYPLQAAQRWGTPATIQAALPLLMDSRQSEQINLLNEYWTPKMRQKILCWARCAKQDHLLPVVQASVAAHAAQKLHKTLRRELAVPAPATTRKARI